MTVLSLLRRRRRSTAAFWAATALVLVCARPALAANAAPETTVTSPAVGAAYLPGEDIVFVGTAADDVGVTQVRVAIQNSVTKQWWHANGTWGALQWQSASLTRPGRAIGAMLLTIASLFVFKST